MATPVAAMKETFAAIAPNLRQGTTVTDVGSTKAEVIQWADEIFPAGIDFVGGHPMAGKTQSIEGADADLFRTPPGASRRPCGPVTRRSATCSG